MTDYYYYESWHYGMWESHLLWYWYIIHLFFWLEHLGPLVNSFFWGKLSGSCATPNVGPNKVNDSLKCIACTVCRLPCNHVLVHWTISFVIWKLVELVKDHLHYWRQYILRIFQTWIRLLISWLHMVLFNKFILDEYIIKNMLAMFALKRIRKNGP